ncbi:MAG: FG-GAP repeat domain-containing protein, partial [Caulobacterales bacterium]
MAVFNWVGPSDGSWNDPGNWTENGAPTTDAPGAADQVDIEPQTGPLTVTGDGQSSSLTLISPTQSSGGISLPGLNSPFEGILLSGDFVTGAVALDGAIAIDAAHSLTVTGDLLNEVLFNGIYIGEKNGIIYIDGAGAELRVGGTLDSGLTVLNGGEAFAGTLLIDAPVYLDGTSSLEVGTLGDAVPGTVTIDPGGTIRVLDGELRITAVSVIDNGVIETGIAGGALTISAPISGSGTLLIEENSNLAVDQVAEGVTVRFGTQADFAGPAWPPPVGGTLTLSAASLAPSGSFGAAITGFAPSDTISFGGTVTSATWHDGLLTLLDGQTPVGELHLLGDYGGVTFTTTSNGGATDITAYSAPMAISHDFTGTGHSDILFGQTNGEVALWQMSGTAITGGGDFGNPGGTWHAAAVGDFDGDGFADILFQDASGNLATWQMSGTSITGGGNIGNPGGTWAVAGAGDFNGDGKSDILFADASGNLAIWEMNGTAIIGGGAIGNPGGTWQVK